MNKLVKWWKQEPIWYRNEYKRVFFYSIICAFVGVFLNSIVKYITSPMASGILYATGFFIIYVSTGVAITIWYVDRHELRVKRKKERNTHQIKDGTGL